MATAEIRRHWTRVAALRCIISDQPATLHHAKGGSMLTELGLLHGMKKKPSDWLVIPLAEVYHTGYLGIEHGVRSWERRFGTQVAHLDQICLRLGYDVWERAGIERRIVPFFYTV